MLLDVQRSIFGINNAKHKSDSEARGVRTSLRFKSIIKKLESLNVYTLSAQRSAFGNNNAKLSSASKNVFEYENSF